MANRIAGNVYIIDSASIALTDGLAKHIQSIVFYSTDTTGECVLTFQSNTTNTFIHIRNNQAQPFSLPYYLGGVTVNENLRVQTLVAGTAFMYLG